jgi:hypothetical protein
MPTLVSRSRVLLNYRMGVILGYDVYSLQYIAIKNDNLKDFEKSGPPVKHVFPDF